MSAFFLNYNDSKLIMEDGVTDTLSKIATGSSPEAPNGISPSERLPDSPTSRRLDRIAAIHMEIAQGGDTPRKFRYLDDIARNSSIARAARDEWLNRDASTKVEAGDARLNSHDIDINRQQEVFEALDRDTQAEKQLNDEMASVVIGRLDTAKSCAEKILSVLQALATAERSYSKALKAIGALTLTGDADGASLREALTDFVQLPSHIGSAMEKATQSSQPPINLVRDLVSKLRDACTELRQGSLNVQSGVDLSVKALKQGVQSHSEVCKAFDALVSSNKRLSNRKRSIECDPWIAEARIVQLQTALRKAQSSQRTYLAGAFRRVGELERQRITVTRMALMNCVEQMSCSISRDLQDSAEAALASLGAIDGESDLDSFNRMAEDSIKGGDNLSHRQSDLIQYLWRQVERSSEIVRQGPVNRLEGSSWATGHAVLTRSGFLHWFKLRDVDQDWSFDLGPTVSINLPRCEFELGDAPSWRLIESAAGSWWGGRIAGQTYSTSDVDSCMEWTVSLKEMITFFSERR
jgi:hypothetical protein